MSPRVISVAPQNNFTLLIAFDSGEEGVLDMKEYLDQGIFKTLQDPVEFKRVKVAFKTIEWACGADLDPEFVYCKTIKFPKAQQA